jgi:hypothetical protein
MERTRRELLATTAGALTLLSGCINHTTANNPERTEMPVETDASTTDEIDCVRGAVTPTAHAVNVVYARGVRTLEDVTSDLGSPDTYTHDSAFGDSVLSRLYCTSDDRGCGTAFESSLESLERIRDDLDTAVRDFEAVVVFTEECSVSRPEVVREYAEDAREKTGLLVEAVEGFIAVTETHVEEGYDSFQSSSEFESAMDAYRHAYAMDVEDGEDVYDEATRYR